MSYQSVVPCLLTLLLAASCTVTAKPANQPASTTPSVAPTVSEFGASASRAILVALAPFMAPLAHAAGTNPLVATGLLLGFAPLVAMLSWGGYRLGVAVGGGRLSPVGRAAVGVRA